MNLKWRKGLILVTSLLVHSQYSHSQSCAYDRSLDESTELCTALSGNSYISSAGADQALNKILSAIGASKRFILKECDGVNNASAAAYKGVRYIFYNKTFMNQIISRTDNWSNLSILAHEVGHHINGHTMDIVLYASDVVKKEPLEESRKQELEADEFSGFVLAQLGATKEQALQVMKVISSDADDSQSTHPARYKRLRAITTGYQKGLSMKGKPRLTVVRDTVYKSKVETKTVYKTRIERDTVYIERKETYEDFFYKGMELLLKEKYTEAVGQFTRSLEMNDNFPAAHNNLGLAYSEIGNREASITAFKKAIALDKSVIYRKNLAKAYFNSEEYEFALNEALAISELDRNQEIIDLIAKSLFNLQRFDEAKKYFEQVQVDNRDYTTYLYLGLLSAMTKDFDDANAYLSESIKLNPTSRAYFNRALTLFNMGDLDKAFKDLEIALKLDQKNSNAHLLMGNILFKQNKALESCESWSSASALGNKQAEILIQKYCLAINLLRNKENEDF